MGCRGRGTLGDLGLGSNTYKLIHLRDRYMVPAITEAEDTPIHCILSSSVGIVRQHGTVPVRDPSTQQSVPAGG
jgi:hypothetical protein